MPEYIKKSDVIQIINKHAMSARKIYKDNSDIKSLDLTQLINDIENIKTYRFTKNDKEHNNT